MLTVLCFVRFRKHFLFKNHRIIRKIWNISDQKDKIRHFFTFFPKNP